MQRKVKNEDGSICENMCIDTGDCPLSDVGIALFGCPEKIAKEEEASKGGDKE